MAGDNNWLDESLGNDGVDMTSGTGIDWGDDYANGRNGHGGSDWSASILNDNLKTAEAEKGRKHEVKRDKLYYQHLDDQAVRKQQGTWGDVHHDMLDHHQRHNAIVQQRHGRR